MALETDASFGGGCDGNIDRCSPLRATSSIRACIAHSCGYGMRRVSRDSCEGMGLIACGLCRTAPCSSQRMNS